MQISRHDRGIYLAMLNICNRLNNLQALGTNVIKNIDIDTDGKTKYMYAYNNSYTFPKVDSICESRMSLSRTFHNVVYQRVIRSGQAKDRHYNGV
jgi:hypothetical protein